MNQIPEAFFTMLDLEFNGKSWNGPSLMATLQRLSAEEAASTATWEGYSAWEVAIHCASCKAIICKDAGKPVAEWTYDPKQIFAKPAAVGQAAWEADKQLFTLVHDRCSAVLRGMSDQDLAGQMASWKAPWMEIVSWLLTHDAFHAAQIRSMGLPAWRDVKQP